MISAKDVPANARILTVSVDGELVELRDGQTIYEVTDSCSREVPTLCYDPRLEAFGSCRLCVVEVEGIKNPVASCTTKATDGMVIKTRTNAIEQYRKTLLEMVASENRNLDIDPLSGYSSQELGKLIERYEARTDRFCGEKSGKTNQDDKNPFILRDYDNCISCYRCVRVCAEQEGDHAINII
ncbi:MAG: 2Fe-2S iron-sulfur cluster-binding protein, partial [Verrucomicrobiota bacterium]|nr:2Fe-2S iron-sulfur cluster-binding protein [Verrucomicrobiota bacterium]